MQHLEIGPSGLPGFAPTLRSGWEGQVAQVVLDLALEAGFVVLVTTPQLPGRGACPALGPPARGAPWRGHHGQQQRRPHALDLSQQHHDQQQQAQQQAQQQTQQQAQQQAQQQSQ